MQVCLRELLNGLKKRGFRLNTGIDDTNWLGLAFERFGGYYLGQFCLMD